MVHLFPVGLAKLGDLEYGDMSFVGNGPDGFPVLVGVERKKLNDLLNSVDTGRLMGHQIPGMLAVYGERYLVVEGQWRANPAHGMVELKKGKGWYILKHGRRTYSASGVWNFLNSLDMMAGVRIRSTSSPTDTVRLVAALFHWWSKEWTEHRSISGHSYSMLTGARLYRPSLKRRIAAELPGIGSKRSADAAKHFDTIIDMIMAEEKEWLEIDGIGKVTAHRIYEELRKGR